MARILITDDTAFMRMFLKSTLVKLGHEVVGEANHGAEALSLYQSLKPDLVTMDITMPVMDGITAIKELKKIDGDVKIVMCSAIGQQDMVLEAISLGALDFIIKPFTEDRVREVITSLFPS